MRYTDNNSALVTWEDLLEYELNGFFKEFLAARENPSQKRELEMMSKNTIENICCSIWNHLINNFKKAMQST